MTTMYARKQGDWSPIRDAVAVPHEGLDAIVFGTDRPKVTQGYPSYQRYKSQQAKAYTLLEEKPESIFDFGALFVTDLLEVSNGNTRSLTYFLHHSLLKQEDLMIYNYGSNTHGAIVARITFPDGSYVLPDDMLDAAYYFDVQEGRILPAHGTGDPFDKVSRRGGFLLIGAALHALTHPDASPVEVLQNDDPGNSLYKISLGHFLNSLVESSYDTALRNQ